MIDSNLPGILIYGAGGQAKVTLDAILKQQRYKVVGFVVDETDSQADRYFLGIRKYCFEEIERAPTSFPQEFIVAIGDNATRRAKMLAMKSLGFRAASIVHPFSSLGYGVQIGGGVLICAGAVVDAEVSIGDGVIVNVGAAIGHETQIESFVHIGANSIIGARCVVESLSTTGMCASVISGLHVGHGCFVAAGALVTKPVPNDAMAIGAPARFRDRLAAP